MEETPFTQRDWVEKLYIMNGANEVKRIICVEEIYPVTGPEGCKEWIKEIRRNKGVTGDVGLEVRYEDFKMFV